jgi:hypothetical protein
MDTARDLGEGSRPARMVQGRRDRVLHLVARRDGRSVCQEAFPFASVASDVAHSVESTYD